MAENITVNMTINDKNNLASGEVESLINEAISKPTEPVSVRPTRASKVRALSKIRSIHEWENCSENSKLFKQVEEAINEEFDSLHPEERCEVQDDEESEYSESEEDEDENLSFVDSDSEHANDSDSWSAAESEPETESEDEEESEESEEDTPQLTRQKATVLDELNDITSDPPVFARAETPTRGVDDLSQHPLSANPETTLPAKRKRILVDDSD